MALKCFKNLGLFMTMRHICFWQQQLLQEEAVIEMDPYGVSYTFWQEFALAWTA